VGKVFVATMEEQISPSQIPQQSVPTPGTITPEQLEMMKARAREAAMRTTLEQRQQQMVPQQVVYVRRNPTVAELILVLFISCSLVTAVQIGWEFAAKTLPRIEIRVK
jgi:hypothetical protein